MEAAAQGKRSSNNVNNVNEAVLPGTANGGNANDETELVLDAEHLVQKNASMTHIEGQNNAEDFL